MLWAARISRGLLVGVVAVLGCTPLGYPIGGEPDAAPDAGAIAAVVLDVYSRLGDPENVYLATDGAGDGTIAQARIALQTSLSTSFRATSERLTGDAGASVALGRFNLQADDRVRVVASFVQASGDERGCVEYVLTRTGNGWSIDGTSDLWPDCPLSVQGDEAYHEALTRVRSSDCTGFWANVGICGEWLYIAEGLGYGGTESWYDRLTGLVVGRQSFTDVADEPPRVTFGDIPTCEATITETVPCLR